MSVAVQEGSRSCVEDVCDAAQIAEENGRSSSHSRKERCSNGGALCGRCRVPTRSRYRSELVLSRYLLRLEGRNML